MKKLLFSFLSLFLALLGYGQNGSMTGDQLVCPGKSYTYKIYFARTIDTDNSALSIYAPGGEFANGSESITLYVYKGMTYTEVSLKWKDIGAYTSISATHTFSGTNVSRQVSIASTNKTNATDYSQYGFKSSPYKPVDKVIKIPYGATANLSMSVNFSTSIFYRPPMATVTDQYKTSKYMWEINGTREQGGNSKSIQYTASNLDGTTISVYPIFTSCDKTSYGPATTYKIERYIDAKMKVTEDKFVNNIGSFTYKLEGTIPAGTTIQWSSSDPNVKLISGQGTSSATFQTTNLSSRYIKVKATLSYASKQYPFENSDIWVGLPLAPLINNDSGIANGSKISPLQYMPFSIANPAGDITVYSWNGNKETSSATFSIEAPRSGSLYVNVKARNKYGWSSESSMWFEVKSSSSGGGGKDPQEPIGGFGFSIKEFDSIKKESRNIKVYNLTGALVYSEENVTKDFNIHSTTLSDGIYIIEKSDGESKTTEKIILKR